MAEGSSSEKDCSKKSISDKDSSDESTDPEADRNFSSENQSSLLDPELRSSMLNKKEWKIRFRYLSYEHFCRHTRAVNERQTDEGLSTRENTKRDEESDCFYADDKGYLQGEIYDELESGEDLGFAGDVSWALNLMPPVSGQERTSEDAEPDSDNPEIIVVPSAQFVREISSEN